MPKFPRSQSVQGWLDKQNLIPSDGNRFKQKGLLINMQGMNPLSCVY